MKGISKQGIFIIIQNSFSLIKFDLWLGGYAASIKKIKYKLAGYFCRKLKFITSWRKSNLKYIKHTDLEFLSNSNLDYKLIEQNYYLFLNII